MSPSKRGSEVNLFWAVFFSTFAALVLMLIELPQNLFYFWPDWIVLVVAFWALTQPDRIGPFVGFIIGTLIEVLFVRNFGVLGFGLAALAFVINSTHQQLRVLSAWQQMLIIGLFIGVFKLVTGWFSGLVSDFVFITEYWYSLLGDILVWPFVSILLYELRRLFRVR